VRRKGYRERGNVASRLIVRAADGPADSDVHMYIVESECAVGLEAEPEQLIDANALNTIEKDFRRLGQVVRIQVRDDGRLAIFVEHSTLNSHPALRRAESAMSWLEAVFPKRITGEEIGDALEEINRWVHDPACKHVRAKITVKVVSTAVFMVLNTIRYVLSSIAGKKTE
jgi:hypothetical protein